MKKTTNILAERVNFGRHVYLHMMVDDGKSNSVAQPCAFTKIKEGELCDQPMLKLDPDQAQLLADELWRIGFRPTQGKQSEGRGDAIDAHLQDMRQIAFHKLGVPKA
jgi:hypothetical protein